MSRETGTWSRRRVGARAATMAGPGLAAVLLLAGCGGPPNRVEASAGSCAAGTRPAYLRSARLVFIGTMQPGPAVSVGGGSVLVSPARVKVARYLKGTGLVKSGCRPA